jgi:magnesium-transporting ATPase (P-type)
MLQEADISVGISGVEGMQVSSNNSFINASNLLMPFAKRILHCPFY